MILGAAAALRLWHWAAVREAPFVAELAADSQEYDRWGRAILAGDWLGSQVFFQAPLYPYLVGFLYRAIRPDPDVVYLFQIAAGVGGCYALYRAGRQLVDARLGLAAAALMAAYPVAIFHDVQLLKESLAASLVCFLLWGIVTARERGSAVAWAASGLLLGLAGLLRENLLLTAPLLAPLALRPRAPIAVQARRIALFLAAAALPLAPVAARNASLGGGFLPTTFQGGVNFYIGNNPQADGTYRPLVPGKQVPAHERSESVRLAEQAVGRSLSPPEVSRHWRDLALDWARREPLAFARLQLRKLELFWSWYEWPDAVDYYFLRRLSPALRLPWWDFGGVTLLAVAGLFLLSRRDPDERRRFAPVLLWVAGSTLTTVLFFVFSRYRLPMVPALLLLAGLPLHALAGAIEARRARRAAAWSAVALAALLVPRLADYGPRWDLVHFNLGRLHEERGRLAQASREYEAALAAEPATFLAALNLGNIAARGRRYAEARSWYERAAALEPRSDEAAANLGGACLALGDHRSAEIELGRALDLNPRHLPALHSLALLRLAQGRTAEARSLNERVLAVQPDHPQASRLRQRLDAAGGRAGEGGNTPLLY